MLVQVTVKACSVWSQLLHWQPVLDDLFGIQPDNRMLKSQTLAYSQFRLSSTVTVDQIFVLLHVEMLVNFCPFNRLCNLRSGVPIFFRGENKGTPDRRLLWWQCLSLGRLTDWWVQMSAIWMWMKPHIHLTGWEAILALRKRLKVIRKLPVSLISIEIIRYKSPLSSLSSKFYFLSIKFICHYHGSIEINLSKHFFTVMARHSLQALVTVVFCQVFL